MIHPAPFAEVWRGTFLESVHSGHAVICDAGGQIVETWGDPDRIVLPRSSSKMIQALPLIESGAADKFGLTTEQLALACASHQGAAIHTDRVGVWLETLGLTDDAFRCGPQEPSDTDAREALIRAHDAPCQIHNNCSGKHAGFLTLTQHLHAGPEYVDPDHPLQIACLEAFERTTGETSPGYGIDGCSAPNYACTELMRATDGKVALKTGAEGFFIAILPDQKLGIALKAACGTTRAAECAIAALLVRLGVLDAAHPATLKRMNAPIRNWRGIETGTLRPAHGLI